MLNQSSVIDKNIGKLFQQIENKLTLLCSNDAP